METPGFTIFQKSSFQKGSSHEVTLSKCRRHIHIPHQASFIQFSEDLHCALVVCPTSLANRINSFNSEVRLRLENKKGGQRNSCGCQIKKQRPCITSYLFVLPCKFCHRISAHHSSHPFKGGSTEVGFITDYFTHKRGMSTQLPRTPLALMKGDA